MLDTPIEELHFADAPQVDEVPGPESKRLRAKQRELESSAVSYPVQVPIAYEAGRGATVRDVDGNVFLDFFSTIGVLNLGHSHPYLLEAATEQLETLVHTLDFPTEARLDLVEKLNEIVPAGLRDANRVVFGGPTGSDAVEATIKLARHNTGGTSLIAFTGAYHGSTAGAMSLNAGVGRKADSLPLLPETHFVGYPHPKEPGETDAEAVDRSLAELRRVLEDPWGGVAEPAGIWVEPMQGSGGMVVPPEGFLSGVHELAEAHGVPLICDEIQAGFGRTGKWFSCEWDGVSPEAMTVAKGIGGVGLPLAATVYDESLDTWDAGGHVGTFRGNLPAMRAGVRAIEYVQAHDLLAHARETGAAIRDRLREVDSPLLADVRGKGLFIGADIVDADGGPSKPIAQAVQRACYERGVLIWTAGRHGNVLRIMPPLVVTDEQVAVGSDLVADAIEAVSERHR